MQYNIIHFKYVHMYVSMLSSELGGFSGDLWKSRKPHDNITGPFQWNYIVKNTAENINCCLRTLPTLLNV